MLGKKGNNGSNDTMKCHFCGSENLVKFENNGRDGEESMVMPSFVHYACLDCNKVSTVLSQRYWDNIDKVKAEKQAKLDRLNVLQSQVDWFKSRLEKIDFRIKELNYIISDENNSYKSIMEAKEELRILNKEKNNLPGKIRQFEGSLENAQRSAGVHKK